MIYLITAYPFEAVYVGHTVQDPQVRLRQHIERQSSVGRWLSGKYAVLVILQSPASRKDEKRWIAHFRESSYIVLNKTSGGEGGDGYRIQWDVSMLGKLPDEEVAAIHGATRKAAAYQRNRRGIKPCGVRDDRRYVHPIAGHNRRELPENIPYGQMPDYVLGRRYGVCKTVIARRRRELGIASYALTTGNDGQFVVGMPHPRWSRGEDK